MENKQLKHKGTCHCKAIEFEIESDLDKISNGELIWTDVVNKIYNTFMPIVVREVGNKVQSGKKAIGFIKKKEVVSGVGKYGPYLLYNK